MSSAPLDRARVSLEGLALGDAFGERFFVHPHTVDALIDQRALPGQRVWHWTDDTAMAISVLEELEAHGEIDRASLARRFAHRYVAEPDRGYGGGAHRILTSIAEGLPWDIVARSAFGGEGSMGNGSAMRAPPVGAYFADDLERCARQAGLSADPTHAHPDGRAGAIATAICAALVATTELEGRALLEATIAHTPAGPTRDGLSRAVALDHLRDPRNAASVLGSGARVLCEDTVPFSLWCASRYSRSFEEAMWATVSGLGDRDTTCAIVGGIVALRVGLAGLPPTWRALREPLPASTQAPS
ncbi:MAG: ADP-ribosylglycohydrolase family protein [Sandaracinus sp.]